MKRIASVPPQSCRLCSNRPPPLERWLGAFNRTPILSADAPIVNITLTRNPNYLRPSPRRPPARKSVECLVPEGENGDQQDNLLPLWGSARISSAVAVQCISGHRLSSASCPPNTSLPSISKVRQIKMAVGGGELLLLAFVPLAPGSRCVGHIRRADGCHHLEPVKSRSRVLMKWVLWDFSQKHVGAPATLRSWLSGACGLPDPPIGPGPTASGLLRDGLAV